MRMKRITDIRQLRPGDRIVRIGRRGEVEIREYLCPHPHFKGYSIFLDNNGTPAGTLWDEELGREFWYKYDPDRWEALYLMQIDHYNREIEWVKHQIYNMREMEGKSIVEHDCSECAYFRNGLKEDFCSLTGEQAECCDVACDDFEEAE